MDPAQPATASNKKLHLCAPLPLRFRARLDPAKNLGSTWRQERDNKHWNSKGTTLSKAAYLRPQYLPSSYKTTTAPTTAGTAPARK